MGIVVDGWKCTRCGIKLNRHSNYKRSKLHTGKVCEHCFRIEQRELANNPDQQVSGASLLVAKVIATGIVKAQEFGEQPERKAKRTARQARKAERRVAKQQRVLRESGMEE